MADQNTFYDVRLQAHIVLEAETPLVIGSGRKSALTDATILKDVNGLPYIPGTSIAGVVRHIIDEGQDNEYFGLKAAKGSKKNESKGSDIIFTEAKIVDFNGVVQDGFRQMDGNSEFFKLFSKLPRRNRVCITEKGVAKDGGKFDEEVIFKGSRFAFDIEMVVKSSDIEPAEKFFDEVLAALKLEEFRIGGDTRNGFGKMSVMEIRKRKLALCTPADLNAYLSSSSSLSSDYSGGDGWKTFSPESETSTGWIKYELTLTPCDFFSFGSGVGDDDADDTPVRETFIKWQNGRGDFVKDALLIPAASLKGALAHRVAFYSNLKNQHYAMNLLPEEFKEHTGNKNDAVRLLFGYQDEESETTQRRGNCLFSDILGSIKGGDKILNHVKIDKFTSGAMDGALFSEKVVENKGLEFKTTILVKNSDEEGYADALSYLGKALDDIDRGTLPLGGGSGRGHGAFKCKWTKTEME